MMVCTFNEMKLLSFPKEGGSYNGIDDIGQVDEQFDPALMTLGKDYINTRVAGVSSLSKYSSCLKCSTKVSVEVVGEYARCSSATCGLFQAIDDSKDTFAATIMLKTDSDTNEVRVFDKELRQIAQIFEDDITEISLMEAKTFPCGVNKKNIITKVWRYPQVEN